GCGNRLGKAVEFVAVAAREIAAPNRHDVRQNWMFAGLQSRCDHPCFPESPPDGVDLALERDFQHLFPLRTPLAKSYARCDSSEQDAAKHALQTGRACPEAKLERVAVSLVPSGIYQGCASVRTL